jgi:hypothetical protein
MNRKYRVVECDEDGHYLPPVPFEVPMGSSIEMVIASGISTVLRSREDRDDAHNPSAPFSWHIENENGTIYRPDTSIFRQIVCNLTQYLHGR